MPSSLRSHGTPCTTGAALFRVWLLSREAASPSTGTPQTRYTTPPFIPTDAIRLAAVEQQIGHSLNHVLIQHYRGGSDYISEHSDKTLDISHNINIINIPLGAQRTITLRLKQDVKPRPVQRIPLPHNSVFVFDSETNKL